VGATSATRSALPAVSGQWADGSYTLTVDLPGVPQDALSVSVAGRTLVLDVATDSFTWNERIRLPQTLDVEQVSANYVDGRLTVTIPTAPEAAPRRVEISSTPAQPQLAAGTDDSPPADTQAVDSSVTSATE
jgi:HSP20 family protein